MGELSKVIVIDPDDRARRQLQLGFAREGVPVVDVPVASFAPAAVAKLDLPVDDVPAGLVVVRGTDDGALEVVRHVRALLVERGAETPILFAGRGVRRTDAEQAGADEVVLLPAYLRDVVTIGRLLRDRVPAPRAQLAGNLAEMTGVYTLVRAFAALGRSAVLTLIRGLRRGEVRFYHGEVTSAQVGLIHGQAALHQLLLWTDARFDFQREDIVRRQQIPLEHDELFADAERFLAGIRDSSGSLSPSMVLEQDVQRVHAYGKQIPTEVHGVLRMFDGHRVLADVLEDSPYRVFETLRVAQRAVDVGLLRPASQARKKATWRAVLAIEEWLVGTEAPERPPGAGESGPLTQTAARDSQRHTAVGGNSKHARRKRRKRRANTPVDVGPATTSGVTASGGGASTGTASRASGEIDWGSLVPRTVGAEVGPLAGVVPASKASGEITLPTRENQRERLESVMDTEKRDRFFPTDVGLEPSVVLGGDDSGPGPAVPVARTERETTKQSRTDAKRAKSDSRQQKAAQAAAAAEAKAAAAAAQAAAEGAAAQAKAAAAADAAQAKAEARAQADAEVRTKAAAEARAEADADALSRAQAEFAAKAKAEGAARAEAAAAAVATAAPLATATATAATATGLAESAPALPPVPGAEVTPSAHLTEESAAESAKSATDLVKRLVAAEMGKPVPPNTPRAPISTPAVVASESASATVLVADRLSVNYTEKTARLVAEPVTTVTETTLGAPMPYDLPSASTPTASASTAAPVGIADEHSDGIPRTEVVTAETSPLPAPTSRPVDPSDDDRPDPKVGEIAERAKRATPAHAKSSEPSSLVTDIAAVKTAINAVVAKQVAAPATPDATTPGRAAAVAAVRTDAQTVFSDVEEAFFAGGATDTALIPKQPLESFDDLDAGYQPSSFWERLVGKKKPKP